MLRRNLAITVPMPISVDDAFESLGNDDTALKYILGGDVLLYDTLKAGGLTTAKSAGDNEQ